MGMRHNEQADSYLVNAITNSSAVVNNTKAHIETKIIIAFLSFILSPLIPKRKFIIVYIIPTIITIALSNVIIT
jgi:citrate lyase alpha subunit